MRGTRNDPVTVLEEFYPTPSAIPEGTRCLTLHIPDSAEWYGLALGALWELMRWQNYEKVGIDADVTIDRWLEVFHTMEFECEETMPVGATMIWHMDTPPDRWLICDGTGYLKAEYPELYALWGDKYGASPDFFGTPDLRSRLPYGADFDIELDEAAGSATHTLTIPQIPAHTHDIWRIVSGSAGGNPVTTMGVTSVSATPLIFLTRSTGGGLPHNNIPPVRGVNFIVYAGG